MSSFPLTYIFSRWLKPPTRDFFLLMVTRMNNEYGKPNYQSGGWFRNPTQKNSTAMLRMVNMALGESDIKSSNIVSHPKSHGFPIDSQGPAPGLPTL